MANRLTLKNLITSTIFDNLLRKITAPKHQELELLIMDSVVTKEDDIVNDFSSSAADKVASAGAVKTLNDTTLKLGRVQTTTAWLNQSTIPEGDYDVTFENAGQNMFGYTHFKVSVRYLNLGTEYIQLLESVDGRKFRRSNVLNVYGDFEEVTVGEGGGITSVVAGENVEIDYTDPKNPIINFTGGTSGSSTETAPYVLSGLDADIEIGTKASHTMLEAHSFTAADIYLESTAAPTDFAIEVDVKKNGVSIFTTKPKINAGSLHLTVAPVLVTTPTVYAVGDIRTVSVESIGASETGKNLVLSILMHK